jgi:hypothetical protein
VPAVDASQPPLDVLHASSPADASGNLQQIRDRASSAAFADDVNGSAALSKVRERSGLRGTFRRQAQ